jgi:hypothetical protein
MKMRRTWIRATLFLMIGAGVGFTGVYWLGRRAHIERLQAVRRDRERRFANKTLVRRPRSLTEDETALIRDFIAKAREYRGTDDAAIDVGRILVSLGVPRDELASVFAVSEEVVSAWDVEPNSLTLSYRGGMPITFALDEGGRICEAYTCRGVIRAIVEEDSSGKLRIIRPRPYDWKPPPPETPSPSGAEPDQRGKE